MLFLIFFFQSNPFIFATNFLKESAQKLPQTRKMKHSSSAFITILAYLSASSLALPQEIQGPPVGCDPAGIGSACQIVESTLVADCNTACWANVRSGLFVDSGTCNVNILQSYLRHHCARGTNVCMLFRLASPVLYPLATPPNIATVF